MSKPVSLSRVLKCCGNANTGNDDEKEEYDREGLMESGEYIYGLRVREVEFRE